MPRPNIVYLHSHDTGRYIQPYGHAIATPNLQRLAEEGVLFRQAVGAKGRSDPAIFARIRFRLPVCGGLARTVVYGGHAHGWLANWSIG